MIAPIDASTAIRRATLDDIPFVEHLSNRFSREVGFIPRIALENRVNGSRGGYVGLAVENDEPAGFLHTGSLAQPECRIFQAAIQYDAQRAHLGQALVADFLKQSAARGVKLVTLRCLSDLLANAFWRAQGFRHVDTERVSGRKNRGALLFVWAKRLHTYDDLLTAGFIPPPISRRTRRCRECDRSCTYTRGPKGQLWTLRSACVRKRA